MGIRLVSGKKAVCAQVVNILLLVAIVLLPFVQEAGAQQEQTGRPVQATVTVDDCLKCHEDIPRALQKKGMAHQTLCLDCHRGHPPADMEIIPSCSRCHQGASHFALDGCMECHTDPHTPLEIRLTHKITAPCLTCHSSQIEQLRAHPSIHSKLACTACHNYHGQIQPCQNCHLPHSDNMGLESCGACHKAHMPLVVAYGQDVAPEYCGSCHDAVYQTLTNNLTKHRMVSCALCHTENHGMIPACENCHGRQHPEEILAKFDKCRDCHGHAHDLNPTGYIKNVFVKRPRDEDSED